MSTVALTQYQQAITAAIQADGHVVPETFVEAAKTLARLTMKVDTRMVDPASWKALRDAAETVDALDRKPR